MCSLQLVSRTLASDTLDSQAETIPFRISLSCFIIHSSHAPGCSKYGGTSVGTPERIRNVACRLVETQREGCQLVAVISAMAGVTDDLLKLAHKMSPQPAERELDILLATGEYAAAALTAMAV